MKRLAVTFTLAAVLLNAAPKKKQKHPDLLFKAGKGAATLLYKGARVIL